MDAQITLRLPADLLRGVDRARRLRRKSRSAVIREALESYVNDRTAATADRPYDRVKHLCGILSGGPPDLGAKHSEYLKDRIRDRR